MKEPSAKTQDMAIRALLEDKLYIQRDKILGSIPYPMRVLLGFLAYRQIKATLDGRGTGRLSSDEIMVFRAEIWRSFNGLLESSK
ncbi:hypothetical protein BTUL_0148g00070 [Botrytis tulipae]|uniref:Uncharacterized protein n=1 Tax=Botrytis tulipae TaxID=87230 RepID=A0A4Z1EHN9_9HELO|nr:hypothetical protein BTUL_0148g00070 [Botrytis tulipae]